MGNLLGKGSFAGVYRAVSLKTGLEVAIKMVSSLWINYLYNLGRDRNSRIKGVKLLGEGEHPSQA